MVEPSHQDFIDEHIPYRLELLDSYCAAILLRVTTPSNNSNPVAFGPFFYLPTNYGMQQVDTWQLINLAFETSLHTDTLSDANVLF